MLALACLLGFGRKDNHLVAKGVDYLVVSSLSSTVVVPGTHIEEEIVLPLSVRSGAPPCSQCSREEIRRVCPWGVLR